jgi:hypothetical protein
MAENLNPEAFAPADPAADDARSIAALYERLADPFENTFKDQRGGVDLEYITGEQCVSRLNEVLGFCNWQFRILDHGINPEADEVWVRGELRVSVAPLATGAFTYVECTRQQFGSQKIQRGRNNGVPRDIGFDLKGAATDCLKKCASLIGIGLYLSKKEQPVQAAAAGHDDDRPGDDPPARTSAGAVLTCQQCGRVLEEIRFKDGDSWTPVKLAEFGTRKHGRVLCMEHYREANAARAAKAERDNPLAF